MVNYPHENILLIEVENLKEYIYEQLILVSLIKMSIK